LKERGRQTLRDWVYSAWLALGGPAIYATASQQDNANTFFELLETLEKNNKKITRITLYEAVERLYAKNTSQQNVRVQIMTIHKAKGLEFDIVLMPSMHKTSANNESKLLEWLEVPSQTQQREWLFATIPAKNLGGDQIYYYVREQQKQKEMYELARVFYVGVTRAKQQVHLIGQINHNEEAEIKKPSANSFMGLLWPHHEMEKTHFYSNALQNKDTREINGVKSLRRVSTQWSMPQAIIANMPYAQFNALNSLWEPLNANNPDKNYVWQDNTARCIGTLIHEILHAIGQQGLTQWLEYDLNQFEPRWKVRLAELGLSALQQDIALHQVNLAIKSILNDEKGQWILSEHKEAKSEYALTGMLHDRLVNVIIDRTFVEPKTNERWIIDYKTSSPQPNQSLEAFLTQETQAYTPQLALYTKLLKKLDNRVIRAALYFPMIKAWQEVVFTIDFKA
jgi:ATP-dependent exoDNAse (exonuclease V) beta subunit